MQFQAIRNEICKRLGDIKNQKFITVAGEYFLEALSNILMGDNFTPTEVPELVSPMDSFITLSSGYGEIDITALNVLKVYHIEIDPSKNSGRRFIVKLITPEYAEKVKISSVLYPAENELYTYQENAVIRIITSPMTKKGLKISIINIKYPQSSGWLTQDLTTDLHYSPRIIDNAITGAVKLIAGNYDTK